MPIITVNLSPRTQAFAEWLATEEGYTDLGEFISEFLRRHAEAKAKSADALIPNEETQQAMRDAREGKTESFESIEALIKDLNDSDD
jgi:hypothetical protein